MFVEQTWPGTDVTISVFAFLQILMMEGDSLFDLKVQLWPIIYAFFFCFLGTLFGCNSTHGTKEHILLTSSDLIEIREPLYSSVTVCVISRYFTWEDF